MTRKSNRENGDSPTVTDGWLPPNIRKYQHYYSHHRLAYNFPSFAHIQSTQGNWDPNQAVQHKINQYTWCDSHTKMSYWTLPYRADFYCNKKHHRSGPERCKFFLKLRVSSFHHFHIWEIKAVRCSSPELLSVSHYHQQIETVTMSLAGGLWNGSIWY